MEVSHPLLSFDAYCNEMRLQRGFNFYAYIIQSPLSDDNQFSSPVADWSVTTPVEGDWFS
eukprot:1319002-Amorphochlora_amoeboformis.AAC.1